jgi:hypothetical protein
MRFSGLDEPGISWLSRDDSGLFSWKQNGLVTTLIITVAIYLLSALLELYNIRHNHSNQANYLISIRLFVLAFISISMYKYYDCC